MAGIRPVSTERKIKIVDPESLDRKTKDDLVRLGRDGFGRPNMTSEEVLSHLKGDYLQLLHMDGKLVGFASYKLFEFLMNGNSKESVSTVLYLSGVVVEKAAQGARLGPKAIATALDHHDTSAFALRTQNPVMHAALDDVANNIGLGGGLFPSLKGHDDGARHIAKMLAKELGERNFDESKFTEKGTYGGRLNDSIPEGVEKSKKLFKHLGIDIDNGDSAIFVLMRS